MELFYICFINYIEGGTFMFNKENTVCCCIFTIIAGLLAGVGIAATFFAGLVVSIPVLLIVTLVFGVLSLLFIAFQYFCNREESCHCINNCLIASTVGSIISSIFALALTTLAAGAIPAAILVGVVAFFLVTNIIFAISAILCFLCIRRCR